MRLKSLRSIRALLALTLAWGQACSSISSSSETAAPNPPAATSKGASFSFVNRDVDTHKRIESVKVQWGEARGTSDAAGPIVLGQIPAGENLLDLHAGIPAHVPLLEGALRRADEWASLHEEAR